MPTAHLTSMETRNENGFEIASFLLSTSAVMSIAKKAIEYQEIVGGKDILKEMLASYYTAPRRPSAAEIADVSIEDTDRPALSKITLKIRRGHWELAAFIKEHVNHGLYPEDSVFLLDTDKFIHLDCHQCRANLRLDPESLP